jgi:hypothetical protein
MIGGLIAVILAVAAGFGVGDRRRARLERRKAEQDQARALTYRRSIP